MTDQLEQFNLYFSKLLSNTAYYLGINTKMFYRYDFNLISASFTRKRRLRKIRENK